MNRAYANRGPFGLVVVMFAVLSVGAGCGASDSPSNSNQSNGMVNPNTLPNGMFGNQTPVGNAGNSGGAVMNMPQQNGTGGSGTGDPDTNMPMTGVPHSIGNTPLPCNVSKAVAKNCQMCHGAAPIGGAPMALVTYEDFQAQHTVLTYQPLKGQTMKVYELAKVRINDHMSPMPPGGDIAAEDFTAIDTWLAAGATAGTANDASCTTTMPPPGETQEGSYGPLTALPGETCYNLKVHGATDSVDDSKFMIPAGEEYVQFYFDVPWDTGAVATRFGTLFDNQAMLHHWLLFTTSSTQPEGYSEVVPLPTLIGDGASLLAGWAVGGTNLAMPDDVGFELPAKGTKLNAQWHFYNSTGSDQGDASSVQICTVPAGTRPHTASLTYTGTEDLNGNKWTGGAGMPPHQMSSFQGTCDPLRAGMDPSEPIHIIGFLPHMHRLGVHMDSIVNHKATGMSETIFTKPFDFMHQIHYLQNYDLAPGDTITAKCTYNNTTDVGVPYGESSDTEMCYNFVISWPSHALSSNTPNLLGALNTCL